MQKLKIIISGGGTGGHIFPAIAIANALKARVPNIQVLFIGAEDKMEMEKVPAAGYPIEGLWISGFQRSLSFRNLLFPVKLVVSLFKAWRIIKKFKPDAVIGVGGFASGPTLRAAIFAGIPTLIQEQNSYPGITNKILSKKVNRICVAYEGMEKYFPQEKIILTGNPVRQDIQNIENKRARAFEFFNLSPDKKTLLVIGGSLGAKTINETMAAHLDVFPKNDIQLIWQTGKSFYPAAQAAVKPYEKEGIITFDFLNRMEYAYAAADVVVSRAGASSVSELCVVKRPAVLIPYPYAAEDHQTKNAMALVNHNAAVHIRDAEARDKLILKILELFNNDNERNKLADNISKLALRDSADVIASEVLNLANEKR